MTELISPRSTARTTAEWQAADSAHFLHPFTDFQSLARKGSRTAFFDGQGKMVIDPQEELYQPFSDGLQPMRGKDAQGKPRWGYADAKRQLVLAPAWDEAGPFVDGLAVVGLADAWASRGDGAPLSSIRVSPSSTL